MIRYLIAIAVLMSCGGWAYLNFSGGVTPSGSCSTNFTSVGGGNVTSNFTASGGNATLNFTCH